MRTMDEYLELPYRISLVFDRAEDGASGWVAEVEDLPGCLTQGATPEDAVNGVRDAMKGWISVALEDGRDVPEPRERASHSGRLLLRIPRSLHAQLASEAERDGVSLNHFISSALAGAIGWRRERERALA